YSVGQPGPVPRQCRPGRHVDDGTASALAHFGYRVLTHQQLASEVDVQGTLPDVQWHLADGGIPRQEVTRGQRRIVVQHIDAAEFGHRGLHNTPGGLLVGEVAAECDRPRPGVPNRVGDLGRLVNVDIDDRDRGALTRQFVRRRRTDPTG